MPRGLIVRRIPAPGEAADPSGPKADDYLGRLVKYVPSEVVAMYLALTALVPTPPSDGDLKELWVYFAIAVVATPVYLWVTIRRGNQPVHAIQLVFSTIAFVIWAIAMGGPFQSLEGLEAHPRFVSALLIVSTFSFPLFPLKEETAG
ncbi:MAG TPA: hypothetical protein VMS55_27280 [Myxococcota bacterium]|nr:hypothetical protein [Myxococcota bacterium]